MTAELLKFYYRDFCAELDDEKKILVYVTKTQFLGEKYETYKKNYFSCPHMNECLFLKKHGYCSVYYSAPDKP